MYYPMRNHLYYSSFKGESVDPQSAKLKDLKYFVREQREIDQQIANTFPITDFGSLNEPLRIKHSGNLISYFEMIDAKKIDFTEELKNIEFIGFTDKDEAILNFKEDNLKAAGVYNFTYEFFDDLFKMGKYANYCLENNYHDLLKQNVVELFNKQPNTKRQYRIVEKNGDNYLRGNTSSRYQNYDNHIAIYLILLALNKFSSENNINFIIDRAYLSDSEIKIFFEQENVVNIPGVGNVYFGALVTNSEIRESAFSFEIRYKIVHPNKSDVFFGAVPDLKDAVFKINHSSRLNTIESKLENIFHLNKLQTSMVEHIKALKSIKNLSSDALYKIFDIITNSRSFKVETKNNFRDLYDKNVINNTLTLIESLNLIDTITTDIDEKIYLERIYHQLITDILSKQK